MNYVKLNIVRPEEFKKVERLFKIVSENNFGYLAGGFVRYIASPHKNPPEYRDVDVFTTGTEAYHKLIQILTYQEKLEVKIETKMSITYKTVNNEVWKDCPMINLIKPQNNGKLLTYGQSLEDILNNFDFSICRVGILNETECLADQSFYWDEKKKRINVLKMESPVACMARICKYSAKGYKMTIPDMIELFREWDLRGDEYKNKIYNALKKLNEPKFGYAGFGGGYPDSRIDEDITYQRKAFENSISMVADKLMSGEINSDKSLFDVNKVKEKVRDDEVENLFDGLDSDNLYDLIRIG